MHAFVVRFLDDYQVDLLCKLVRWLAVAADREGLCHTICAQVIVVGIAVMLGCSGTTSAPLGQPNESGTIAGEISVPDVLIPDVEINVTEPNNSAPVSVGMAVTPAQASPGETVMLVVRAKLASGWHIYAADRKSGTTVPTSLALQLPNGLEPTGDWQYPEPELYESVLGPTYIYHDEANFLFPLRVSDDAAGNLSISCEFSYLACNDDTCLRPTKLPISADLSVVATP